MSGNIEYTILRLPHVGVNQQEARTRTFNQQENGWIEMNGCDWLISQFHALYPTWVGLYGGALCVCLERDVELVVSWVSVIQLGL